MAGRRHRPHQGRAGLHPQQPHRPGRHARPSSTRSSRRSRRTCWSWSTRRTSSSCGWPTRSTASRPTAATRTSLLTRTFSKAYGLAGLPGRLRRRAARRSPARCAPSRCRSASPASPRPRRSPRSTPSPSCSSGSRPLVAERARVVAGLRDAGWDVPEPQGNFVWFELGRRAPLDFARRRRRGRHRGPPVRRRGCAGHHRRARGQRPVRRAASAPSRADTRRACNHEIH